MPPLPPATNATPSSKVKPRPAALTTAPSRQALHDNLAARVSGLALLVRKTDLVHGVDGRNRRTDFSRVDQRCDLAQLAPVRMHLDAKHAHLRGGGLLLQLLARWHTSDHHSTRPHCTQRLQAYV